MQLAELQQRQRDLDERLGLLNQLSVFDSFEALLHPEDRERALAAVGTALDPKGDGLYDCEMRLVRFCFAKREETLRQAAEKLCAI